MNGSTAMATVLVDELVRGGATEAVLAPGSRSAPLALALEAAERAGRLRLHVRVDERSAGFLALGLAKASGVPVPVVTTSGTAVAELHAAVLEAHHTGVPVVVLSADRPRELAGTGANQTTDQPGLFGGATRLGAVVPEPAGRPGEVAGWRALVCRALAAAAGELDGDPGPVHLDVPLREPLLPDDGTDWVEDLGGRPDGGPWTVVSVPPPAWSGPYDGDRALGSGLARTLVVVGDCPGDVAARARRLAARRGWPLVAEPGAAHGPGASAVLAHGGLLLAEPAWLEAHRPERVLVVGRPTLARPVQRLLADPRVSVEVVATSPRWADPPRTARAVHHVGWLEAALREPAPAPGGGSWSVAGLPEPAVGDAAWAGEWRAASGALSAALPAAVEAGWPSGPAVARALLAAVPAGSLVVVGSSNPVRDLELAAAPREDVEVLANRGVAGIDGVVSTAVGAALAVQRDVRGRPTGRAAYALLGDLTFLHDANGLLLGPHEPRPDLTLVVVNDDGGGIFSLLEQGEPGYAAAFERVFGTPTGADLAALCASRGVRHERVGTAAALTEALGPQPGLRVVEVVVARSGHRAVREALHAAAAAALGRTT